MSTAKRVQIIFIFFTFFTDEYYLFQNFTTQTCWHNRLKWDNKKYLSVWNKIILKRINWNWNLQLFLYFIKNIITYSRYLYGTYQMNVKSRIMASHIILNIFNYCVHKYVSKRIYSIYCNIEKIFNYSINDFWINWTLL